MSIFQKGSMLQKADNYVFIDIAYLMISRSNLGGAVSRVQVKGYIDLAANSLVKL